MSSTIPCLSRSGWVTDTITKMKLVFIYFLTSRYSQSNTFRGKITSLKHIVNNFNDPLDLKREIKESLEIMYLNYFDQVEVTVSFKYLTEDSTNANMTIDVVVTEEDGTAVDLSQGLELQGTNLANIYEAIEEINKR